jgi:hypothetical protein
MLTAGAMLFLQNSSSSSGSCRSAAVQAAAAAGAALLSHDGTVPTAGAAAFLAGRAAQFNR